MHYYYVYFISMSQYEKGSGGVGIIIVVVLIAATVMIVTGNRDSAEVPVESTPSAVTSEEVSSTEDDPAGEEVEAPAVENEGEAVSEEAPVVEQASGTFIDYSDGALAQGPETQVLFFHASWCPSCRTLEKNLNEEQSLPEGVAVYKVDFDSSDDLKAKYEVRNQHTLVQVDREGNMITKWSGGNDTESILEKIQA